MTYFCLFHREDIDESDCILLDCNESICRKCLLKHVSSVLDTENFIFFCPNGCNPEIPSHIIKSIVQNTSYEQKFENLTNSKDEGITIKKKKKKSNENKNKNTIIDINPNNHIEEQKKNSYTITKKRVLGTEPSIKDFEIHKEFDEFINNENSYEITKKRVLGTEPSTIIINNNTIERTTDIEIKNKNKKKDIEENTQITQSNFKRIEEKNIFKNLEREPKSRNERHNGAKGEINEENIINRNSQAKKKTNRSNLDEKLRESKDEKLNNENPKMSNFTKFECPIHIGKIKESELISLDCDHYFCQGCLFETVKSSLNSHIIYFYCPNEGCKNEITYYQVKNLIKNTEFDEKYESLLLNKADQKKKKNEKTVKCKKCKIPYFIWNEAKVFDCRNCQQTYCSECYEDWEEHRNIKCEELKNKKISPNDKEFEIFVRQNKLMKCPQCGITVEKTKYCNFMYCESNFCKKKTIFCYICGVKLDIKDKNSHFIDNNAYAYECVNTVENKKKEIENIKENFENLRPNSIPISVGNSKVRTETKKEEKLSKIMENSMKEETIQNLKESKIQEILNDKMDVPLELKNIDKIDEKCSRISNKTNKNGISQLSKKNVEEKDKNNYKCASPETELLEKEEHAKKEQSQKGKEINEIRNSSPKKRNKCCDFVFKCFLI